MNESPRPRFDADLIEKYGGEGPRYTSYPTAVQFSDTFSAEQWKDALDDSNRLPIPADLSLYVHVPFCSSPCFYCGCNRVITRSKTAAQEFLVHLEKELDLAAPHFDRDRKVRQVHLGGGTPTFLETAQIGQLMRLLRSRFSFAADAEIGLEVDPRSVTPADIRELKGIGFNRISIGIQDLDPEVQKAVNRIHDAALVASIIGAARAVRSWQAPGRDPRCRVRRPDPTEHEPAGRGTTPHRQNLEPRLWIEPRRKRWSRKSARSFPTLASS